MFYVTGMHSSGTSLVAKYLNHLGIDMGSPQPSANSVVSYPHYEDLRFRAATYQILNDSGFGFWPNCLLPRNPAQATDTTIQIMRRALRKRSGEMWGFKEPYNSLTVNVWVPELYRAGFEPTIVHVFRRPAEVIDSFVRHREEMAKYVTDLPASAEVWWKVFNQAVIDHRDEHHTRLDYRFVFADDVITDDAAFCREMGLTYRPISNVRDSSLLQPSLRECDHPDTVRIWERLLELSALSLQQPERMKVCRK